MCIRDSPRTTRDVLVSVIVPKNAKGVVYLSQRNQSTDFPVLTCCLLYTSLEQTAMSMDGISHIGVFPQDIIISAGKTKTALAYACLLYTSYTKTTETKTVETKTTELKAAEVNAARNMSRIGG